MPTIPHEVFIKQVLPIPPNVKVVKAKNVDMSKSDLLSLNLEENSGGGGKSYIFHRVWGVYGSYKFGMPKFS